MVDTMLSRRAFFGMTAGGALALYLPTAVGYRQAFAAPIPGGSLSPRKIPKFRAPLVVPPAMPTIAPGEYEVAVRQIVQQILPPGLPATPVWGYGSAAHPSTFHYPAFTIEARRGTPTTVTWVNDLIDGSGHFLPHLLPVDPTLHWANPPGGVAGRDSRPTFTSTPGPYRGPVPVSVHVHGMEHVPDWSDGYAEAWFLPDAADIPSGYATVGTWHDFFAAKAASAGLTWSAGRVVSRYPNTQVPSTLWYHDHVLGMTRLNVYAGPAGFWLLRSDDPADNPTVAGSGAPAVLPGPAPQVGEAAGHPPPRDPAGDPGPVVPRGRLAVLPRLTRVLRRLLRAVRARDRGPARSGTRSSSATAWWSTGVPGRSSTSSRGATASVS